MQFFTLISRENHHPQQLEGIIKKLRDESDPYAEVSVVACEKVGQNLHLFIATDVSKRNISSKINRLITSTKWLRIDEVRYGWQQDNKGKTIINEYLFNKLKYKPQENDCIEYKQNKAMSIYLTIGGPILIFVALMLLLKGNDSIPVFFSILFIIAAIIIRLNIYKGIQRIELNESCLKIKVYLGKPKLFPWNEIESIEVKSLRVTRFLVTTSTKRESYTIQDFSTNVLSWPIFKTIGKRAGLVVLEYGNFRIKLGKPDQLILTSALTGA
jgi:hypothetical protein